MRVLALIVLLFSSLPAAAQESGLPPLPPLTDPATNEHLPGNMAVLVNATKTGLRTLEDAIEAGKR